MGRNVRLALMNDLRNRLIETSGGVNVLSISVMFLCCKT